MFPLYKEDRDSYQEWREEKIEKGRIQHHDYFNADTWAWAGSGQAENTPDRNDRTARNS